MKFNVQFTEENLEQDGVWIEMAVDNTVSVKMRRADNAIVMKHMQLMLKKNRKALRNEKENKKVTIEFLSKYVIVDWKGITLGSEEYPYSVENAETLLSEAPDFYKWVESESQNLFNFSQNDSTLEERGEELKK